MTVFIIPSWYPSEANPIIGSFFKEQAEALARRGHTVIVAYAEVNTKKREQPSGLNYRLDHGVHTYLFSSVNFTPRIEYTRYLQLRRATYSLYKRCVKRFGRPDVIHAHSCNPGGALGAWLSKKTGIPLVTTEHSSAMLRGNLAPFKMRYVRQAVSQSSAFIAVGQSLQRKMNELGAGSILIPNMIDVCKFSIPSEKRRPDRFTFGFLGTLVSIKGVDVLIKAFSAAFADNNSVSLLIGGKGDSLPELRSLAEKSGCAERISFAGEILRKDVPDFFHKIDCFVLPSRMETFGVVLIEAMASGLPVVATRCGGPESIVNSGNGLLVDVDDEKALSGAMLRVYRNIGSYDPSLIRRDCIERFGEDTVIGQIEDVYRQVTSIDIGKHGK